MLVARSLAGHHRGVSRQPFYEFGAQPNMSDVPGTLSRLVPDATARLDDVRGTPLKILEVDPATATFRVRVEAFEDAEAVWTFALRDVASLRFPQEGPVLPALAVRRLADADSAYRDVRTRVPLPRVVEETHAIIRRTQERAERLLAAQMGGRGLRLRLASAVGEADARLVELWEQFAQAERCAELEQDVATAWVSNPRGYETVKAHMIVMARMGLTRYTGPELRDSSQLTGLRSVAARRRHVTARLGFVRAVFARAGVAEVQLWRGFIVRREAPVAAVPALLSATFDRRVALQHFRAAHPNANGAALHRASVPVDRLFMTYLETAAMSSRYLESEAVVLGDGSRLI